MNTEIDITNIASITGGLIILGAILKNAFPAFPNRYIPACTWLAGMIVYQTVSNGWADPKQWVVALLTAATATGTHSAFKNTIQPTETDK